MSCIECEIQSTVSLPCGCERELLSDGACQLVGYDGDAKKIVAAIEAIGPLVKAASLLNTAMRVGMPEYGPEDVEEFRQQLEAALKPFEGP